MSRAFEKTVKLLNNIVKLNSNFVAGRNTYKIVVSLPSAYIRKTFYSDKKSEQEPKTSFSSLMVTELSQETVREHFQEEAEARQARESSWRTMKYTLVFLGVSFVCFGTCLIVQFGSPAISEDGSVIRDEFSNMPTSMQYFYRTLKELDYYKRLIKEPSREKLLPDELSYPYLQPKLTLVLELTDVLVHPDWTYQTGWRFKKRPGIEQFLESLSGLYEIVIYTAEQGMTVFPIIEALDPKNLITYKLVRDATHFVDGHHVKNLDKLNRDLTKVIVVDWNQESVKFHPENMFQIPRWNGSDEDTSLIDLAAFLLTVASSNIDDVRCVLQYYNQFENGLDTFRDRQRMLLEQQEAGKNEKLHQSPMPVKHWSRSLGNKPSSIIQS